MKPKYFDNARLAVDLALSLGAKGTDSGNMANFSKVDPDWICPGCARDKINIARLDKNGNLFCSIHNHHDHLFELIAEKTGVTDAYSSRRVNFAIKTMCRFKDEHICMDCNLADAYMKRVVGAPKNFSFSPREIYDVVCPGPNQAHYIPPSEARAVYDIARRSYDRIIERAEGILARDFHDIY